MIEIRQQVSSNSGSVSDMFHNSFYWFALEFVNKLTWVFHTPLDFSNVLLHASGGPLTFPSCSGSTLQINKMTQFRRGSNSLLAHSSQTLTDEWLNYIFTSSSICQEMETKFIMRKHQNPVVWQFLTLSKIKETIFSAWWWNLIFHSEHYFFAN